MKDMVTERCFTDTGTRIVVELMSRNNVKFENVILDAAFCQKMGILTLVYTSIFSWAVNRICNEKHIPIFMIEAEVCT